MSEISKVAVLGAGSWGTGLAMVVSHHAKRVILWDIDEDVLGSIREKHENSRYLPGIPLDPKIGASSDPEEALQDAGAVVVALPTVVIAKALGPLAGLIPADVPVISASKGLGQAKLRFPSQIIRDTLGREDRSRVFVLSGPSFAKETARRLPTAVAFAGEGEEGAREWAQLFHSPFFRAYPSGDIAGVEVAGAFKNVIAIAAGAVDGLGIGTNARSAVITRGLAEIMRAGRHFGAQPLTFQGLAGMGDLVLTCTGPLSRNRRLGYMIAQGKTRDEALKELGETAEGFYTAKAAKKLSDEQGVDLPISNEVYLGLYEGKPPKDVVKTLMSRPMRPDVEA